MLTADSAALYVRHKKNVSQSPSRAGSTATSTHPATLDAPEAALLAAPVTADLAELAAPVMADPAVSAAPSANEVTVSRAPPAPEVTYSKAVYAPEVACGW